MTRSTTAGTQPLTPTSPCLVVVGETADGTQVDCSLSGTAADPLLLTDEHF